MINFVSLISYEPIPGIILVIHYDK
jgi:hypothetical protein